MSNRSSGFDFADRGATNASLDSHPDLDFNRGNTSTHLQRNKTERRRLQGLQRTLTTASLKVPFEAKSLREKWDLWMINDGGRHMFFIIFILLHLLVAVFGFFHYQMKDNSNTARQTFGITFRTFQSIFFFGYIVLLKSYAAIARTAALVLHVDVIFILLPVCRNFVSLLRRTPLNDIIPFDKNLLLHKATAWSIVIGSLVHILAHIVNLTRLVLAIPGASTGEMVKEFVLANFISGPLLTGWIMTAALGVMVWYAMEKRRRANFEKFWYTHHLFIVFFINWQLHGMFCMIKPDRPPYCSFNVIGVFWVSFLDSWRSHVLIHL